MTPADPRSTKSQGSTGLLLKAAPNRHQTQGGRLCPASKDHRKHTVVGSPTELLHMKPPQTLTDT